MTTWSQGDTIPANVEQVVDQQGEGWTRADSGHWRLDEMDVGWIWHEAALLATWGPVSGVGTTRSV